MIVKNEGCSTAKERKCFYTWGRPSLLFNCDRRMLEIHVCDDGCCKQCLFKLDPEQIQVEILLFFRISGNSPHLGLLVQSVIEYDGTQTHFSGSPKIHTWTPRPGGLITKRAKHRKHSFVRNKRKCTSRDGRIENQPERSTNG